MDENISVAQREKEFHNQLARELDIDGLLVSEVFEAPTAIENRFVLEAMGLLKGKKILDLGCGAGETSVYFASQGSEVHACDIADELVAAARGLARKHGVGIHFTAAASGRLPYRDNYFDHVFGNGVLHHVDLLSTAHEVRRVLKPGGTAYFVEPLPYNPIIHVYRGMASKVRSTDERPLSFRKLAGFSSFFASSRHREFWLFSLLIFLHFFFVRGWHPSKVRYWKRVIDAGKEYEPSFAVLQRLDTFCLKYIPFANYLCWNTVLEVKK